MIRTMVRTGVRERWYFLAAGSVLQNQTCLRLRIRLGARPVPRRRERLRRQGAWRRISFLRISRRMRPQSVPTARPSCSDTAARWFVRNAASI
jgi:hypothetical protein